MQLFLVTNQLACCAALPVLLGLVDSLHPLVGGGSMIFSSIFSMLCLCSE